MLAGNLPETDIGKHASRHTSRMSGRNLHSSPFGRTYFTFVVCKVISPVIPLVFMGTTVGVCWIAGLNPIYTLLSGGLVLGAVFMATDYTTSPINFKGKIIYAVGCALAMNAPVIPSLRQPARGCIVRNHHYEHTGPPHRKSYNAQALRLYKTEKGKKRK